MFSAKNLPCCIFDNSGLNPHVLFWEQKELTNSLHLIYIYTQLTYTQNVTYASLVLTQILCYIRPQPAPTEAVLTFRCHSQTEHKKKAKAAQPHYEKLWKHESGRGRGSWNKMDRLQQMWADGQTHSRRSNQCLLLIQTAVQWDYYPPVYVHQQCTLTALIPAVVTVYTGKHVHLQDGSIADQTNGYYGFLNR